MQDVEQKIHVKKKKEKIHSTSERTRIGNSTSAQVISKRKVKVKVTLEQATKAQRGGVEV